MAQGQKSPGGTASVAPPDGGWGWMIVASCFLVTICTRAVTRCVSIFFVEFQMHFGQDYSGTAWIHSLVDCTTMLCAPLGSFIGNRLSCRITVMLGGLLSSVGLILSSFATSLEYLYLSLGIVTGLGFALSYTPSVAMVGTYFNERKALAYGIAMSGSGIGMFILAPAIQLLIEHYSWRGALLILGGFVSNLCVCGALMRPLEPKGGEQRRHETAELENGHAMKPVDVKLGEAQLTDGRLTDTKPLTFDLKQVDSNLADSVNLKDVKLQNSKLADMKLAEALLSNSTLVDSRLVDMKLVKGVAVNNSNLTEKMLAELKLSDPNVADGKLADMKLMENLIMDSKLTATDLVDVKLVDSKLANSKIADMQLADAKMLGLASPVPTGPLGVPKMAGCLCLQSMEEFGFLLMPDFMLLSVSFLFLAYGCSVPFVYLVPYALSVGVDHQQAAFLMSILGVTGIFGNITFGWLTDRKCLKEYRMGSYMLAVGMEGLCCLFTTFLHSFVLLVPFSVLYGYFDGAYVALIPVMTSDVVGSKYLSSALGVVYFLHAIPYLVSPPIGGWLVDQTGDYSAAFFLSGFSIMSSSLFLATAMLIRRCWRTSTYSMSDADSTFASLNNCQRYLHKKASNDESKPVGTI